MRYLLCVLLATFALAAIVHAREPQPAASSCNVNAIEQSLRNYQQIKVGMTRAQLERYFVTDGGMAFRERTNYVDPGCRYIKIDVRFRIDAAVTKEFSPNDVVAEFSKLFLDYPVMD